LKLSLKPFFDTLLVKRNMAHINDPHALLLQVMAHDLLAPLTAVKWQSELLANPNLDAHKRAEYVGNIRRSTELGITLAKHAHVAARVLGEGYAGIREQCRLHTVVGRALEALKEQYARHGLSLAIEVQDEGKDRAVDRELVGFFVWLMAKHVLTCAPAGATVVVHGESASVEGQPSYRVSVRVSGVEGAEHRAHAFADDEPLDALDQTFVFSYLLRHTASILSCTITAQGKGRDLSLTANF